jgi:hypothetical protein
MVNLKIYLTLYHFKKCKGDTTFIQSKNGIIICPELKCVLH